MRTWLARTGAHALQANANRALPPAASGPKAAFCAWHEACF